MNKRLLAALLAGCIAVALCACGGGGSFTQAAIETSTTTTPTEPPAVDSDIPNASSPPAISSESNLPSEPVEIQPEDNAVAPDDGTGLFVFVARAENNRFLYEIYNLKVEENGGEQCIASWSPSSQTEGCSYIFGNDAFAYSKNHRQWFSSDFQRIVVTMRIAADGSTHAGWLEADGSFFDVSEALGLVPTSDFAGPITHTACGFTEDMFVFYEPEWPFKFYYVPVENISPDALKEGNPFEEGSTWLPDVTDWIDETTCIAEEETRDITDSFIRNIATKETRDYHPESSGRSNWGGVVSPDGNSIAFFSHVNSATDAPSIFTASLSGGEPIKVEHNLPIYLRQSQPLSRPSKVLVLSSGSSTATYCTLLDWR